MRGSGEELGAVEGEETVIRILYVRKKIPFSTKGEKRDNPSQ